VPVPALDGLAFDASADAVIDAQAPFDADAGQAADASDAATPFCPQDGAVLCSDFDEADASIGSGWDYVSGEGTTTQASTAFWVSAPRSLNVTTSGSHTGGGLYKTESFAQSIELSFDVYIAVLGGNLTIGWFTHDNGVVYLQPLVGSANVVEATDPGGDAGTQYASTNGPGSIPLDTWTHVDFELVVATHTVTASYNGVVAATRVTTNPSWSSATSAQVALGIADSDSTLYYDNVTIRTH
jgi:hypothetical protein